MGSGTCELVSCFFLAIEDIRILTTDRSITTTSPSPFPTRPNSYSCEIRADGKDKTKWLARIDHIGAIDQTRVFIAVTWFYQPNQLPKMANKPRTEPGEIFLSDHVDILETSNVESESECCSLSLSSSSSLY